MFSANDGICKAWTQVGDNFLRSKKHRQSIMVSKFLLPFGRLNLLLLSEKKQKEVIQKTGLTILEIAELFEYKKNKKEYWDEAKLHKQIVSKTLPIVEVLYSGYSLLFFFDNTISHSVYANNALRTGRMNKSSSG